MDFGRLEWSGLFCLHPKWSGSKPQKAGNQHDSLHRDGIQLRAAHAWYDPLERAICRGHHIGKLFGCYSAIWFYRGVFAKKLPWTQLFSPSLVQSLFH